MRYLRCVPWVLMVVAGFLLAVATAQTILWGAMAGLLLVLGGLCGLVFRRP